MRIQVKNQLWVLLCGSKNFPRETGVSILAPIAAVMPFVAWPRSAGKAFERKAGPKPQRANCVASKKMLTSHIFR